MEISITLILIIITVGLSLYAWNRQEILHKWIFNPYTIQKRKEYFRFVTSGFIHKDYMHLFFNMFTLYFFGRVIEYIYQYKFGTMGIWFFLILYLVGMVVSDIPSYFKHKDDPGYNALGASGAVTAVVFSSILFNPVNKIYIFGIFPLPGFVLGALYLIYAYQRSHQGQDGINHDAHLYGALFGIAFSIAIEPSVILSFAQQIGNFRFF